MGTPSATDTPASAVMWEPELAPLRPYWHPVAYSRDIGGEPVPAVVLGEPTVLFRSVGGIRVFRDLCPHRGAKLSLGHVRDGRLVCPYHGFQYDDAGICRLVPSQPPDRQAIPSRLRLERYQTEERYGIVWVALAEPVQAIPALPHYDDLDFHANTSSRVETWNTSAARWMENFSDITHLPHVHAGVLGDPTQPVCDPYQVIETPTGFVYEFDMQVQYDPARWPTADNDYAIDMERVHIRAELSFPFTICFVIDSPNGRWVTFRTGVPVTTNQVRFFTAQARNYNKDPAYDDVADERAHFTAEQDRVVTESQSPEMLPVDLTEEVHLRIGDAISIAYRRRLRELGLDHA